MIHHSTKPIYLLFFMIFFATSCFEGGGLGFQGSDNDTSQAAVAGSYANMLVVGSYLYSVYESDLTTFDVTNENNPVKIDKQIVNIKIESIYHVDGLLFLGSPQRMLIYKIQENGKPSLVSQTNYELSLPQVCNQDPIVVKGTYAYVSLATSQEFICSRNRSFNQLRIYDVVNISKPKEIKRIDMRNPRGLAYKNDKLFVCDTQGIIVFDIKDETNPKIVKTLELIDSYDLIVKNNILIVVTKQNLYLYDITDLEVIKLISKVNL